MGSKLFRIYPGDGRVTLSHGDYTATLSVPGWEHDEPVVRVEWDDGAATNMPMHMSPIGWEFGLYPGGPEIGVGARADGGRVSLRVSAPREVRMMLKDG